MLALGRNRLTRLVASIGETERSYFKGIGEKLDAVNPIVQKALTKSETIRKVYLDLAAKSLLGDGEKAIQRHTKLNKKLLAHDRVKRILDDPEKSLYLSTLAGWGMEYGNIASAGVISVIGKVSGRDCIVVANDATVKGGTVFPITLRKQMRAQEIAFHTRLPCIYLVDSGGGFLPLQSEFFADRDHGGRAFRNEAVLTAMGVPQVSLVCGNCTAGGAYIPAMCEEAIIVDRIGTIFLGGPPLVKASTGEEVTAEDLGGATLHCNVSGVTDHFAATEEEAFQICRDIIITLNLEDSPMPNREPEEPLFPPSDLNVLSGLELIDRNGVYQILARLLDGSRFQEFKQTYGGNLVCGFGFLTGHLVGIVANCGPLSSPDSLKGAHFVELCSLRGVPLLFLQNSHSVETLPQKGDGIILKDRSKMIASHSCANVPKICINIGGCFGDDNYLMCGFGMDPTFLFSWPGAHTALSSHPNLDSDPTESQTGDQLLKDKKSPQSSFLPSSAFFCSSRLWNDGIVLPDETRQVLSYCTHLGKYGYKRKRESSHHQQAIRRL